MSHGRCVRSCYFALFLPSVFLSVLFPAVFRRFLSVTSALSLTSPSSLFFLSYLFVQLCSEPAVALNRHVDEMVEEQGGLVVKGGLVVAFR